MPIFNNILAGASGQGDTGHSIDQSLRVNHSDSAYLDRTPSSAGNRKTWTISAWVKIANLASTNSSPYNIIFSASGSSDQDVLYFESDDSLVLGLYASDPTTNMQVFKTSVLFRDISAWYHIVVSCDTTAGSNYVKLYINGEEVTDFSTDNRNNAALSNHNTEFNNTYQHRIGKASGSDYLSAYLADFNWIDGQALTPASFGETNADTNQWQAIEYTGSYGTNGFYLKFQDSSALGDDSSGNTNDFTVTNLAATDQVLDSPSNNFSTLNPLMTTGTNYTYSEGNLKYSTASFRNGATTNNIAMTSGKWYWEIVMTTNGSTAATHLGVVGMGAGIDHLDSYTPRSIYQPGTGNLYQSGSSTTALTSSAVGDIIGFALDVDSNELSIYKNNSSILSGHSLPTNSDGGWLVQLLGEGLGNVMAGVVNFGQDSSFAGNKTAQGNGGEGEDFYYTPPTGYKALNTDNLDDPAIALPTDYFNTVLYTGNGTAIGSGGLTVTGVGFQPDFTWVKQRNTIRSHNLYNSVVGTTKRLESSNSDSEATDAESLSSWNSDGFVVGNRNSVNNSSSDTYASWNWKGGGTASSNTDGTITSSVSANPTAGFSIVSYTGNATSGATVGHGLSQAPEMLIVKQRDAVKNWSVLANSDPTDYIMLNSNNATADDSGFWNDTNPSSSVFTLGSIDWVNANTNTYIAYCFHSVEGYSKVGGYTGNGSTNGAFVYTGFRPAFLLIKRIDAAGVWPMFDNKRAGYNWDNRQLRANETAVEETSNTFIDILSNGFKCKNTAADKNASGGTYTYLAFAESPFKYSNAR